jgi:hypothetical protein
VSAQKPQRADKMKPKHVGFNFSPRLEEVRKLWLEKGPYGKLHKVEHFVHENLQRCDKRNSVIESRVDKDFEGRRVAQVACDYAKAAKQHTMADH